MAYSLRLIILGIGMCLYLAEACFAVELPRPPVTATNTWTVDVMCQSQEEGDQLLKIKTRGNYITRQNQWIQIGKRLNLSPAIIKAVNFDKELVIVGAVHWPNHVGWVNPQLTNNGELTFFWAATKMLGQPEVYGVNFVFYKLWKRPFINGPPITKVNGIAVRY